MVEIVEATTAQEYVAGKALIEQYAANLGVDLCFQGFAEELANLERLYGPPTGCLLLARERDECIGCVAVRAHQDGACELKRLYVKDAYRGSGAGRALTEAAVARARKLGYRAMVLDTLEFMTAAQSLYRSLGFRDTAEYYANPLPGVRYMRLDL